jgi:nicotinamidase-related amidase
MTGNGDARRGALLLIDFQRDFLDATGRMPVDPGQVEPVITAAQKAVEEARARGELIVKIGNEYPTSDRVGNLFRRHAAIEGSEGAVWDARIDPSDATYLPKWRSDAFCNPTLASLLEERNVDKVCLAGLFAKACVTATAKSASERGYSVQVRADATACRSEKSRAKALDKLRRNGVQIV